MNHEIEAQGANVTEAIGAAAAELGVEVEAVEYTVLDEGARKRFGLGSDRPASIRAWVGPAGEPLPDDEASTEEAEDVQSGEKVGAPLSQDSTDEEAALGTLRDSDWDTPTDIDDAELDKIADVALEVVREILKSFDAQDAEIEEYEGDEGEIILDVVGVDLAVLIGRHGRTLDSLQSLVSTIVNRKLGFRYPVIVDIEGYRHRRRQKVESIALSAAERAVRQKNAVRLRPMVAGERRAVHMALRGNDKVYTESEGQEPNRLVVIIPKR